MELNIISATFGSDSVEITWAEDNEESPQIKLVRLVIAPNSLAPEALEEVRDLLEQVVNESVAQLRLNQGVA